MLDVRFQPMTEKPADPLKRSRYLRSEFDCTRPLDDLEKELARLKATDVVIESGHRRTDIRNDGWPRGGSAPDHPEVRLWFNCKHGRLKYECGAFDKWEDNLRAISLWIGRQRKALEEWGIGTGGEAYRGFAQLPAGNNGRAMAEWRSAEDACRFIIATARRTSDGSSTVFGTAIRDALAEPSVLDDWFKSAAKIVHPDAARDNGSMMSKLNRARDYIVASRTH